MRVHLPAALVVSRRWYIVKMSGTAWYCFSPLGFHTVSANNSDDGALQDLVEGGEREGGPFGPHTVCVFV